MTQTPMNRQSEEITPITDAVLSLASGSELSASSTIAGAAVGNGEAIAPANSPRSSQNALFPSGRRHSGVSLGRQLLTTVMPLAIAPLLVASAIGYWITQNQNRAEVNRELEAKALLVGEIVGENIADKFNFTQSLGSNPVVIAQIRGAAEAAQTQKLTALPAEELEKRFSATRAVQVNQGFNDYLTKSAELNGFEELIVTDRNGLNVGYSILPSDFVQNNDDWWKGSREKEQWIGDIGFDESRQIFGINFSQTIEDRNGNFLGVVKFLLTAAEFSEIEAFLSNAGLRGTQKALLFDPSSNSVLASYAPDGAAVFTNSNESLEKLTGDKLLVDLSTKVVELKGTSTPPAEIERQLQAAFPVQNLTVTTIQHVDAPADEVQGLSLSFAYQGKQYTLTTIPRVDWLAIASMDVAEIQAAGRGLLNVFGLTALALGGVAAAITLTLSRQLSSPLNNLSDKAQQVSDGNLDVTASMDGTRETQTLARTFNTLVSRVKASLREQMLNTRRANLAAEITGAKVTDSAELQPVFARVVDEARDILDSDRVVVYQFADDWNGTIVAESVGFNLPSAYNQGLNDPCIPEATRNKYVADGILMITDVATANLHPEHLALLRNLKVKSILGVPIVSQGRLYGLLITHHCHATHEWQPSEIDFMRQMGLQVGLVIERVKLLEQTQELAEEQRQIKEGLQRNALQLLMDVDPVSQGNLTVRAKVTEDEIGTVADSYNATIASLRKIVLQVQEAARQVSETTSTNETSVRTLSVAAAQQAEEILAALERTQEMADSVRQIAANAEQADLAMQQAAQTVEEGDEAMNRTVDGILAIRNTVAETAKKVKRLGESSQKISNVVNLISGFAAQTNMLALNAAIEASRAGESGKGFAVVADEVRELARQSAEATTEIEKLVASIQMETNEVVTAMESGTEQVVAGTQLVDETRQSLNKITTASRQISQLVESITQATVVQSQASETVTEAMNTVAAIAQQNSSAASQVSESFEQLRSVAQALQEEVGRFKVS